MCAWCTAAVVIMIDATAQGFLSLVASTDMLHSLTGKLLRLTFEGSKAPAIASLVTLHTVKGLPRFVSSHNPNIQPGLLACRRLSCALHNSL